MDTISRQTLGEYLKGEREARLMSIAAVSRALKVDSSWILSLEQNNFSVFPSMKDIPGFLKRYADFLLIDGEDLVKRCEMQLQVIFANESMPGIATGSGRSKAPMGDLTILRRVDTKEHRQRRFRLAAFAAVVAFPIIIVGIYSFFYRAPVQVLKDDLKRVEKSVESLIHHPSAPQQKKIIANRDSRRYHLPGMRYYDKVEAYHRVEFNSEQEAIAAGYHKAPR